MKIFVITESFFTTKVVKVQPNEPVNTLLKKLNIPLKDSRFRFNGMKYDMRSSKTFAEIGMEDGDEIVVSAEAKFGGLPELAPLGCLAKHEGGGPEHICPYGCGRMIPDGYKGCTELLQERPNYFN